MSGLRMRMMDVRAPRPRLASAGALAMPRWWTGDDAAARNAAERGCPSPGSLCAYCRKSCPLAKRTCRACAMWSSADGVTGLCERGPADDFGQVPITLSNESCGRWRART